MPCASSWIAQSTISSTERLWPRWITSPPRRLQDAPHDVDRRVVAVEQARRGDEADLVHRLVDERLAASDIGHREPRDAADASRHGGGRRIQSLPERRRRGCPARPLGARPYMTFT